LRFVDKASSFIKKSIIPQWRNFHHYPLQIYSRNPQKKKFDEKSQSFIQYSSLEIIHEPLSGFGNIKGLTPWESNNYAIYRHSCLKSSITYSKLVYKSSRLHITKPSFLHQTNTARMSSIGMRNSLIPISSTDLVKNTLSTFL
jgi:hypothetical protein